MQSPIAPSGVSFREAFKFWLTLGCISFGGPAGQISIMHDELVVKRRWLSERRFLHALNYCMVLPGPEAQQLATYIGWLMHRTWGGIVAGGLFVLPSLVLLIAISWAYLTLGHTPLVAGLFYGIKPAVCAIVLQAAYRIGSRTLKNPLLLALALAAFVAIFAFQIAFPWIVLAAALIGYIGGRGRPACFVAGAGHAPAAVVQATALIDDDTPTPAHAVFSAGRAAKVVAAGLALWVIPMAWLFLAVGWDHLLTQMAWFFTKAALLTFGGAYAVLPYVYQGAVEQFGWLSAAQMMDGLALGETTPGPLIMVLAFVGFVGGYLHLGWDASHGFLAGTVAACLVTWFTFLPSFVFIFLGGPFVETTRHRPTFTAPLTAITAALVGVILSLALFLAYHVLWPQGLQAAPDGVAALMMLAAVVALLRYQRNVIQVIAVSALAGMLISLLK